MDVMILEGRKAEKWKREDRIGEGRRSEVTGKETEFHGMARLKWRGEGSLEGHKDKIPSLEVELHLGIPPNNVRQL